MVKQSKWSQLGSLFFNKKKKEQITHNSLNSSKKKKNLSLGSPGHFVKIQTPYKKKLGLDHIANKYSTAHIHVRDAHHFSSALSLFKLGQASHMPRLKTIKLNLTFKSHTPYPSNQGLNIKQAWGAGSTVPLLPSS